MTSSDGCRTSKDVTSYEAVLIITKRFIMAPRMPHLAFHSGQGGGGEGQPPTLHPGLYRMPPGGVGLTNDGAVNLGEIMSLCPAWVRLLQRRNSSK